MAMSVMVTRRGVVLFIGLNQFITYSEIGSTGVAMGEMNGVGDGVAVGGRGVFVGGANVGG